jgi:hypothetical protein
MDLELKGRRALVTGGTSAGATVEASAPGGILWACRKRPQ